MTDSPLIKQLPGTPDSCFHFMERLQAFSGPVLLDSAQAVPGFTRYSMASADPFCVLIARDGRVLLDWRLPDCDRPPFPSGWFPADPLQVLQELLERYRLPRGELPFCGGAAGFFSYDLGRSLERIPVMARSEPSFPDLWLGFYDWAVIQDHPAHKLYLVSTGLPFPEGSRRNHYAARRLADWQAFFPGDSSVSQDSVSAPALPAELCYGFTAEAYEQAVEQIRTHILEGDAYIINLSQRCEAPLTASGWELYRQLRGANPAPMAAYLDTGPLQIACASPERFLSLKNGQVETRPIKGTRPRGRNPVEDIYWRNELANSEKDKAELAMVVDLERNDLSRVCAAGSVVVPELYRLETYETVYQLVSVVQGQMKPGLGAVDLIRAAFPGGSVTGAPKIRAMEIIEKLEPVRRGPYCGALGYLDFQGDMDLNIIIRSLIIQDNRVFLNVGGGITIESDPKAEYLETLDKARASLTALGLTAPAGSYSLYRESQSAAHPTDGALGIPQNRIYSDHTHTTAELSSCGLFETIRIENGTIQWLALHLSRLRRSAAVLGLKLPFSDAQIEAMLLEAAKSSPSAVCAARLTLTDSVTVTTRPIPYAESDYDAGFAAGFIPWQRSGIPADFQHKTTACAETDHARAEMRSSGYQEGLWVNDAGLVLEGTVSNLFALFGGTLKTPPVHQGLLPGIARARVLALAPKLGLCFEEVPLTPAELWLADELFLTNALMLAMPVTALEDNPIGNGKPGPIACSIRQALIEDG